MANRCTGGRKGGGRREGKERRGGAGVSFILQLNPPGRFCYITSLCVVEEDFVGRRREGGCEWGGGGGKILEKKTISDHWADQRTQTLLFASEILGLLLKLGPRPLLKGRVREEDRLGEDLLAPHKHSGLPAPLPRLPPPLFGGCRLREPGLALSPPGRCRAAQLHLQPPRTPRPG